VNEVTATVDAVGDFTAPGISLPLEGSNTLTVSAKDAAGNSSQATINVILDTMEPVIEVTSPQQNDLFNTTPIPAQGKLSMPIQLPH